VEASGGITLENVASVAKTGIDFISLGALTNAFRAVDISMELEGKKK
jgi:nicotinate-nucleotide pyrophosphorylase (carboxylating)